MRPHFALIPGLVLASAVLAIDDEPISGGVQLTSQKIGTFHTVTASLQVPTLLGNPSDSVSASVSLGGPLSDCPTYISVGVDCAVDQIFAWYHVLPGTFERQILDLPIHVGDTVVFGATAPIHNSTTGMIAFYEIAGTNKSENLYIAGRKICGQQVAWNVANVPNANGSDFNPVADFGTVSLTSAKAYGPTGDMYGPDLSTDRRADLGAKQYNMSYSDGTIVASVNVNSDIITFTYKGD